MSLTKVSVNQGGADWSFVYQWGNFILYQEIFHIKHRRKTVFPSTISQRNESKTLILSEVSFLMIQIFDIIQQMHCGNLAENIYCFTLYVYILFIDFLCHLKHCVKHAKEHGRFHVTYYLILMKNKSEFPLFPNFI